MVWGEICTEEVTHLKRIEGVMDKKNVPFPHPGVSHHTGRQKVTWQRLHVQRRL